MSERLPPALARTLYEALSTPALAGAAAGETTRIVAKETVEHDHEGDLAVPLLD